MVGLLSSVVVRHLAENPRFPTEIQNQLNLDSINFVSNDQLLTIMERTTATPEQVEEAVRINTEARLRALKIGLLIMAGLRRAHDHPGRPFAELPSRRDPRQLATALGRRGTALGA